MAPIPSTRRRVSAATRTSRSSSPPEVAAKLKEAKIDDPVEYYKGKTIQVTGTVIKYREKPEIKIESPDDIKVVEKKKDEKKK